MEENKLGKLLARDQLSLARKNGEAFGELQKNMPAFPPSYKYKYFKSPLTKFHFNGKILIILSKIKNVR